ncbi:hypothetical protein [Kribbella sindirgiensis]|uniref:Uncharacterized protein n=1 Tax=Kribbella sindirgiensis TaxID=1124744 RepID=A0A4R0HWK9_9ACTN|nr:hypothetical protein [Kribbella sindirgiensis]TCC17136.1 hypothetical protein E0H50_40175 [Kribbella sindirgiensis]
MSQYRLLVNQELLLYLRELERAAATQPGSLRARELRALRAGLRAIANGEEADFEGKRLRFATHDLSDCAEIKLPVIPETRGSQELGASHRLIYREFQPEDGGLPYREAICFEHRKNDRPFEVAAKRLGREASVRRNTLKSYGASSDIAPIRQALPQDLRIALAAASNVAPASGAVRTERPRSERPRVGLPRDNNPSREL